MQAARLAAPVGARLAEPGCDRDRDGADVAAHDLELAALADRGLVDVAGEHELGAGVDERGEHVVSPRDRLLPRAPGGPDHVVVEHGDPERAVGRLGEEARGVVELALPQAARLVPPRAHRVEADHVQPLGAVDGLGRLPVPLELGEGAREARGEGVGDVVVARDHEQRQPEATQEARCALVLFGAPTVRQVAARDDHLRARPLDERGQRALDLRVFPGARV